MDYTKQIKESLSEAALCEQLAEECSELAHATLKFARILRGENPTPITKRKALGDIQEEIVDVLVCLDVLGFRDDVFEEWAKNKKLERWVDRLEECTEKR